MSRMASLRAAVTSFSFSSIACWMAGGSCFSSGAAASSAGADADAAADLDAGFAASAVAGSASRASRIALLVVLVLIRPVLAFERPVFLVVAHQPFELQLGEHLRRIAPLAQVRDLDLELLLLADDGVDLREARLPQHVEQAGV